MSIFIDHTFSLFGWAWLVVVVCILLTLIRSQILIYKKISKIEDFINKNN